MVYFTADLHMGHEAIIRMQNRPFHNVHEMNEALIANINEQVTNEDRLYILGDIAYRIETDEAENLIRRINGKKYLILGNHDVTLSVSELGQGSQRRDNAAWTYTF